MFCIHCGAKNDDANHFCMSCGQPMEPPLDTNEAAPFEDATPEAAPSPEKPRPTVPTGGYPFPGGAPEPYPDAPPYGQAAGAPSGVIVREGNWVSSGQAAPPPPPAAPAPSRGKPWLVVSLCLAAALAAGGVLAFLLFQGDLAAAEHPAFSILLPAALGAAALIFGAVALVLVLTGRVSAQTTLEDGSAPYDQGYGQPQPDVGYPCVALADTNRPDQAVRVPLVRPVVIGRTEGECDLALPYEKSVSKRHCRIYAVDGVVYLEDLGGRNGTYINGAQVVVPTSLHSGDLVKLGRLVLRITIE